LDAIVAGGFRRARLRFGAPRPSPPRLRLLLPTLPLPPPSNSRGSGRAYPCTAAPLPCIGGHCSALACRVSHGVAWVGIRDASAGCGRRVPPAIDPAPPCVGRPRQSPRSLFAFPSSGGRAPLISVMAQAALPRNATQMRRGRCSLGWPSVAQPKWAIRREGGGKGAPVSLPSALSVTSEEGFVFFVPSAICD
jgi:hypothetical protein